MSDKSYNRLQWSLQFNGENFTVRAETGDELQQGAKEIAEGVKTFHDASVAVRNAYGVMAASAPAEKKTYSRNTTTKPGAKPIEAAGDVPNCACGIPMSDVRGKTYVKGDKAGQPYPYSFYRSRSCKANCDPQ